MLEKIKNFAIAAHENVNHLYGNIPYAFHLRMVVASTQEFIHQIQEGDHDTVLAAAWLHDTIEDCRLTYNDIVELAGIAIAEIVYALSNEKGKTRKERASDKYYEGIRQTQYARYIKLCDRIANVKHSQSEKSPMFTMYQRENENFLTKLFHKDTKICAYETAVLNELQVLFERNIC